jgi:Undecaprenyl-phosphate glucose phosphotransferase
MMSDTEIVLRSAAARDDTHLHGLGIVLPARRNGAVQPVEGARLLWLAAAFFDRRASSFLCKCALLVLDLLLVAGIFAATYTTASPGRVGTGQFSSDEIMILVLAPLLTALSLSRRGAYAIEGAGAGLFTIAIGWLNGAGLLVLGMYALNALGTPAAPPREVILSPSWLAAFVVIGGAVVLSRHALWRALWPRVLPPLGKSPAVVVGKGAGVFAFAEILKAKADTTEVVGVISDLEGGADEVVSLVRNGMVRTVFIVLSIADSDAADPLLAKLAAFAVAVRIVPNITTIAARSCGISLEAGLPFLHTSNPPLSPAAMFIKRVEDILFSLLLLLATAPLMLLVSIAIKLESRGPVLFRQLRYGLNGSEFEVFKFRTMYVHLEDPLALRQTLRGDTRVTRVGRFLRRHSLDELPQLFNVLAGTMSLVGPRPHAPATTAGGLSLELAAPGYMARQRVKPGITGWAQVSGYRGNLRTVEEAVRRVEHDLYYIENWSLLFDLWIILRTLGLVLHDDQAF